MTPSVDASLKGVNVTDSPNDVKQTTAPHAARLDLPTRLDITYSASLLTQARALPEGCPVVIDATKVERLDASCLQILMALATRVPTRAVYLSNCSTVFRQVLERTGALHLFTMGEPS